jgi:hypothetical protein
MPTGCGVVTVKLRWGGVMALRVAGTWNASHTRWRGARRCRLVCRVKQGSDDELAASVPNLMAGVS